MFVAHRADVLFPFSVWSSLFYVQWRVIVQHLNIPALTCCVFLVFFFFNRHPFVLLIYSFAVTSPFNLHNSAVIQWAAPRALTPVWLWKMVPQIIVRSRVSVWGLHTLGFLARFLFSPHHLSPASSELRTHSICVLCKCHQTSTELWQISVKSECFPKGEN